MSAQTSLKPTVVSFSLPHVRTVVATPFTNTSQTVGQTIRQIIDQRGCDDKEFAAELGFSPQLLSMIISGERRLTTSKMEELARVTGRPVEEWRRIRQESEARDGSANEPLQSLPVAGILSRNDILRYQAATNMVEPFVPEHVQPASLDLCLGESRRFRLHPALEDKASEEGVTEQEKQLLDQDRELSEKKLRDCICIKPHETWRIWVAEQVRMPDTLCGRISVRSDIVMEGITPGYGLQVDPGWTGKPFVILTHNGDEEFHLNLGDLCVSLEFRGLSSPYRATPD